MSETQTNSVVVERGRFGRILTARIRPNVDLVEGIEQICADNDISHAEIRGCVGSVMDAVLEIGGGAETAREQIVQGPGLEIALTAGEVRPDAEGHPRARLYGLIANWESSAYAGEFVRGKNLTFVTLELVLQEWLPE